MCARCGGVFRDSPCKIKKRRYCSEHCRVGRTVEERFWWHVVKAGPNDCWEWTGYRDQKGYGRIHGGNGPTKAHRLSYEIATGISPGDRCVCHACDNPSCVNPAHLFLGTNAANVRNRVAKGRSSRKPRVVGEAHGRAKLRAAEVLKIRSDPRTCAVLACEMGVSPNLIALIKRREIWRHLQDCGAI